MPAAHHWGEPCLCWTSLSQEKHAWNKKSSRSVCLLARFVAGLGGCIRNGWKDQSARTVCRSAGRIHISGIARLGQELTVTASRTEHSGTRCAFPACSADAGQKCCPCALPALEPQISFAVLDRSPDILAD